MEVKNQKYMICKSAIASPAEVGISCKDSSNTVQSGYLPGHGSAAPLSDTLIANMW